MESITKKEIIPYLDKYSLIVQKGTRDGGDSAHHVLFIWTAIYFLRNKLLIQDYLLEPWRAVKMLLASPYTCFRLFECPSKPNFYVRHPEDSDKPKHDLWTHDCDRFSRDQAVPLVGLMGILDKGRLWGFFKEHLKRFGMMTNTRRNGSTKLNHGMEYAKDRFRNYTEKYPDFAFNPEFLGLYVRSFGAWYLYPFLFVADFESFLASIHWRFFRKSDSDINNHLYILAYGRFIYPTPLIYLAGKILKYDSVMAKMSKYWDGKEDPSFVVKLWEPIIRVVTKNGQMEESV